MKNSFISKSIKYKLPRIAKAVLNFMSLLSETSLLRAKSFNCIQELIDLYCDFNILKIANQYPKMERENWLPKANLLILQ